MATRLRRSLTFANVCSFIALTVALGTGGAYAANTVFSADIVDGEVKTADIGFQAVVNSRLAPASVSSPKLIDGTIANADLAAGSVNGASVFDNSLTSDDLATSSVNGSEIAPDAVGATEITDNAIDGGEIVNGSLGAVELSTSSVGSEELATGGHQREDRQQCRQRRQGGQQLADQRRRRRHRHQRNDPGPHGHGRQRPLRELLDRGRRRQGR